MSYEKPSVDFIASAVETIKGGKGQDLPMDSKQFTSEAAYQADE